MPLLPDMGPAGRRTFFRESVGRWVERALEDTERRIVAQPRLRPPGALPEVGFLAACTRCGDCVAACPPQIIRPVPASGGLAAGTPFLELGRAPCLACPEMPCAAACPTEALSIPPRGWEGYRLSTVEFLPERCVTYRGTACHVCADACPVGERALTMDQLGHPVLRHEGCVGCGVCVRECISIPSSFTFRAGEGGAA